MAKKSTQSAYQYAPLIAPSNWKGEERQFSIHLTQLLDDLYRKCGALAKNSSALSAYPVGSIYLSLEDKSPAELFGGEWEQIKDTFLLAAGSTYEAGATGGEATHKLTENEMPSHKHSPVYFGSGTKRVGLSGGTAGDDYSYYKISYADTSGYRGTSFTTEAAGGGEAHNNMPPYLAVYVWQRTA